jgi:hypothetical protein
VERILKWLRWLVGAGLLVVGSLTICPSAGAQVRYVDDNGVSQWVSTLDEVPERYRGQAETRRFPSTRDTAVAAEPKLSDVCESQFEFARESTKKLWEQYGRRASIRKYLPPDCADEISKAYPQVKLDE